MALGFQIGAPCNLFQRQCGGQGAAPPAGVFLKDARQRKAVGEKHLQPPVNQQDAAAAAEGVLHQRHLLCCWRFIWPAACDSKQEDFERLTPSANNSRSRCERERMK